MLRLVVFDRTDLRPVTSWLESRLPGAPPADGTSGLSPGLSPAWRAGALLHRLAGHADATLGAATWAEALAWAARTSADAGQPIASLQIWGHGGWGNMRLGDTRIDTPALAPDHALAPLIDALRARLAGPEALIWFRCCSAFGAAAGQRFAREAAARFQCRVAGHTFIIGVSQSGTHSVRPGQEPTWDVTEGVNLDREGRAASAKWSGLGEPSTISCLRLGLPDDA